MKKYTVVVSILLILCLVLGLSTDNHAFAALTPPTSKETDAADADSDVVLDLDAKELEEESDAESEQMIQELAAIVDQYLKDEGYDSFEYDEENEWFEGSFELNNALKACDVTIFIYDDMISVTAAAESVSVPKDKLDDMAIFTTLVNWGSFYGHLS